MFFIVCDYLRKYGASMVPIATETRVFPSRCLLLVVEDFFFARSVSWRPLRRQAYSLVIAGSGTLSVRFCVNNVCHFPGVRLRVWFTTRVIFRQTLTDSLDIDWQTKAHDAWYLTFLFKMHRLLSPIFRGPSVSRTTISIVQMEKIWNSFYHSEYLSKVVKTDTLQYSDPPFVQPNPWSFSWFSVVPGGLCSFLDDNYGVYWWPHVLYCSFITPPPPACVPKRFKKRTNHKSRDVLKGTNPA